MNCIHQASAFRPATRLATCLLTVLVALSVGLFPLPATAQEAAPEEETVTTESATLLEDIVVTAQKREQLLQDVPLSITAFDSEQLEALKVRDLSNLSIRMPNVSLDDVGTARGIANFSIRGLGINSSIPSIDPTVGVFVDGVYLGTTPTVLYDNFDLESVEVLRGPQGVLFGRNVIGGAVLLNTKTPTNRYEATVRSAVEGGGKAPNMYVTGTLNAPLTDSLAARFSVYSNQDQGWFKNEYNGKAFGAQDTLMLRPVFSWRPTDTLDVTLRYEYQDLDGDGPAAQNHTNGSGLTNIFTNFDRDSHDFAVDEEGFITSEVHFLNARADWDVPLGDNATITNIFGWRETSGSGLSDIDATTLHLFHGGSDYVAEQFSNETRYSGRFFNRLLLTTGFYYFNNDIDYYEYRSFNFDRIRLNGGGLYDVETFGLFMAGDYDLTDWLTLTAGLRYTHEEKEASITNLTKNGSTPCNVVKGPACPSHFQDRENWTNLSPKIGLSYRYDDDTLIYAHWTRGFRSGGYNLRDTFLGLPGDPRDLGPGPFDEEQVDNFEIGFKKTFGTRARLNAAFFYNLIDDLQRELSFTENLPVIGPDGKPVIGPDGKPVTQGNIVQVIRNTADADMYGFEVEGSLSLAPGLSLFGSAGFVESDYTSVQFDINNDGRIDGKDEDLEPPRAAKWTYSFGLLHGLPLGSRVRLASRVIYAYRDREYNTDDNLGFNRQQKRLEAGIDIHINDSQWVVGLYGKNLLDEVAVRR